MESEYFHDNFLAEQFFICKSFDCENDSPPFIEKKMLIDLFVGSIELKANKFGWDKLERCKKFEVSKLIRRILVLRILFGFDNYRECCQIL